jgi:hypothetical protein
LENTQEAVFSLWLFGLDGLFSFAEFEQQTEEREG